MAIFPSAVATDSDLYIAVNNIVTDLTAGIDDTTLTIPVSSTAGFPDDGCITIGTEIIKYTSKAATQFNASTRGFDGTTAASHSSGENVHQFIIAAHHNVLKDEVKAIEQNLSDRLGLSTTQNIIPVGSVGAPSLTFAGDLDTGLYRTGADNIGIATNGTLGFQQSSTRCKANLAFEVPDGTEALPSLTFINDTNTGIYSGGADILAFTGGGTLKMWISGSTFAMKNSTVLSLEAGSAASPSLRFNAASTTGLYNGATNTIDFSTNGTFAAEITSSQRWIFPDGSAASPVLSFASDTNTGIYRIGADQLGMVQGGSLAYRYTPAFHAWYIGGTEKLGLNGSALLPNTAAGLDLGSSTLYFNDVNYKTLTDRGCLPWCDEGVELQDGRIVSDTEAIKAIQKHPTKLTVHGLPMLDYKTFPKKSYKKADKEGVLLERDANDEPVGGVDGIEMTMMFGVIIGAIKELTLRLEALEAK